MLGRVRSAMVQSVRNAVAHGIEPPEERTRKGKPPMGAVEVRVIRDKHALPFLARKHQQLAVARRKSHLSACERRMNQLVGEHAARAAGAA